MAAKKIQVKAEDVKVGDTLVVVRQALKVVEVERPKGRGEQNSVIFHLAFGYDGSALLHHAEVGEDLEILAS